MNSEINQQAEEQTEVVKFFYKCTECDWQSVASELLKKDLEVLDQCPKCKSNWVGIDSDWFQK